ncbi:vacuolar protein sorting-associated protein VTA1 homolog isoform X1 [Amphibalanus amphitrite]|uniref:vacuolar protein sorting-associated protein VTA1 homolog isoform X1 n=1 Tax=Amphibalanus amphitrite TaxID=1232801 RepID=UPI001C919051|nr:vacuolar protein sorting-associated protein VTA1 homolog isoform X1 [Amphibalanus amphitrite]
MALNLPPVPAILKPIQHFLKVASEHEKRDPVITYWCRLYALQTGMGIDKSNESLAILIPLMDWLENTKKASTANEAIVQDVVAQAHVENYANRLFLWADKEDRAARFNKSVNDLRLTWLARAARWNVVKAFYTAGVIFDVCETFGELSVEVQEQRKYAKWKAAYIHNCLKNGEQPQPGPAGGGDDEAEGDVSLSVPSQPQEPGPSEPHPVGFHQPQDPAHSAYQPPAAPGPYQPAPTPYQPAPTPHHPPPAAQTPTPAPPAPAPRAAAASGSAVSLNFDQIAKAQKYSKLAYSALNYEDVPTAVANLQKALTLLQTGQDS